MRGWDTGSRQSGRGRAHGLLVRRLKQRCAPCQRGPPWRDDGRVRRHTVARGPSCGGAGSLPRRCRAYRWPSGAPLRGLLLPMVPPDALLPPPRHGPSLDANAARNHDSNPDGSGCRSATPSRPSRSSRWLDPWPPPVRSSRLIAAPQADLVADGLEHRPRRPGAADLEHDTKVVGEAQHLAGSLSGTWSASAPSCESVHRERRWRRSGNHCGSHGSAGEGSRSRRWPPSRPAMWPGAGRRARRGCRFVRGRRVAARS